MRGAKQAYMNIGGGKRRGILHKRSKSQKFERCGIPPLRKERARMGHPARAAALIPFSSASRTVPFLHGSAPKSSLLVRFSGNNVLRDHSQPEIYPPDASVTTVSYGIAVPEQL